MLVEVVKEEDLRNCYVFQTEKGYLHIVRENYKNQPIEKLLTIFEEYKKYRIKIYNDDSDVVKIYKIPKVTTLDDMFKPRGLIWERDSEKVIADGNI